MSGLAWLRRIGEYPGPGYPTSPATPPAPPSVPHAALVRELEATIAELNEERRRSQAFAARLVKLRARLFMSPDEAHRNNLALQERLDNLRAEKEALEREVARLQGRPTGKDFTGTYGWWPL